MEVTVLARMPSCLSATGTGWEPTPWHAIQRAAWDYEEGQGVRL
jgi:hypothetical protein